MTGQRVEHFAGWDVAWREPALPQPGGRDPAPGELSYVQAFVNSHYDLEVDHGADVFATPASLAGWLARRGLTGDRDPEPPITAGDVERAVAIREGLRALADHNGGRDHAASLAPLNHAANGLKLEVRFLDDAGPILIPSSDSALDRALATVLAITARAMIDGRWSRLKVCPGGDCGWAFYDHSRNQSGRWCSMSICGGRSKARAHYRRSRGGD